MNTRTRIKICGLTRADDLDQAVALGVDAIGLVFCERSKRHLSLEQGRELAARVPGFVTLVALLLDPQAAQVEAVVRDWKPDLLQFHGREPAEFCRRFDRRYLKAVAMQQAGDPLVRARQDYADAAGFLLDSHAPGGLGGQGTAFDWQRLNGHGAGLILAGGLHPGNVGEAIRLVRPYAVDVSSGVEDGPGIKSGAKMADFVAAVAAADNDASASMDVE